MDDIAQHAALSQSWYVPVSLVDAAALSDEDRRNVILRATAVGNGLPPQSVISPATRRAASWCSKPSAPISAARSLAPYAAVAT